MEKNNLYGINAFEQIWHMCEAVVGLAFHCAEQFGSDCFFYQNYVVHCFIGYLLFQNDVIHCFIGYLLF